eukprot:3550683-Ditylum_brightwellii.AAC.1
MQVSEDHNMPLCAYDKQHGKWCTVKDRHITEAVTFAVMGCGLLERGYKLAKVGSHSLQTGGAMTLKLNGIDDATIKKMGPWSGDTFMTYIHLQIGSLTK